MIHRVTCVNYAEPPRRGNRHRDQDGTAAVFTQSQQSQQSLICATHKLC
jgi:hypothetical protein